MVENAKGLLCSRMFRDRGDHWAIDASFPKCVQMLTPSTLRQGKYTFFGSLI